MASFSTRNHTLAEVPVARHSIWDVLVQPDLLAEFTPLIDTIDADGDLWVWKLAGISALGITVAPSFTERMTFTEPDRLDYRHEPPTGVDERAGANGTYVLTELGPERTRLEIDITLCVELPLPSLSRRAVEKIMAVSAQKAGDVFAERLYQHLGVDPGEATVTVIEGAGA